MPINTLTNEDLVNFAEGNTNAIRTLLHIAVLLFYNLLAGVCFMHTKVVVLKTTSLCHQACSLWPYNKEPISPFATFRAILMSQICPSEFQELPSSNRIVAEMSVLRYR